MADKNTVMLHITFDLNDKEQSAAYDAILRNARRRLYGKYLSQCIIKSSKYDLMMLTPTEGIAPSMYYQPPTTPEYRPTKTASKSAVIAVDAVDDKNNELVETPVTDTPPIPVPNNTIDVAETNNTADDISDANDMLDMLSDLDF